ncbi:MAG: SDR family NAD(P)-dependent oxidoreductase [Planctomycetota bacterium]
MARYDPIDVDLSGKVAVVTGSNTGIGKEVARGLARLRARVILACRDPRKGGAARDDIMTSTGNYGVEVAQLDQSDPVSIREFARGVKERHRSLDILVNNAGAWLTQRRTDPQGIELTFVTNALGYFRLTNALEPLLLAGAPARIVDVASDMAYGLDLDDLEMRRGSFAGMKAYARSKQANRMLAWVRAERLKDQGVTVNALHPGVVASDISRSAPGMLGTISRKYFQTFGRTTTQGADTALWLAASPEVQGLTGRFWKDREQQRRKFTDMEQNRALWRKCEELTRSDP